jgi:hypothetical protein
VFVEGSYAVSGWGQKPCVVNTKCRLWRVSIARPLSGRIEPKSKPSADQKLEQKAGSMVSKLAEDPKMEL